MHQFACYDAVENFSIGGQKSFRSDGFDVIDQSSRQGKTKQLASRLGDNVLRRLYVDHLVEQIRTKTCAILRLADVQNKCCLALPTDIPRERISYNPALYAPWRKFEVNDSLTVSPPFVDQLAIAMAARSRPLLLDNDSFVRARHRP